MSDFQNASVRFNGTVRLRENLDSHLVLTFNNLDIVVASRYVNKRTTGGLDRKANNPIKPLKIVLTTGPNASAQLPRRIAASTAAKEKKPTQTGWAEVTNSGTEVRSSPAAGKKVLTKLNARAVAVNGEPRAIRRLSLREAMDLDDEPLQQVLEFYFKHPYAHGRTRRVGGNLHS